MCIECNRQKNKLYLYYICLLVQILKKFCYLIYITQLTHRLQVLEVFINSSIVFGLDEKIILKAIDIRKNIRLKLPDAIIAATALTNGLILITRNISDFKNIPELQIIDPWNL